MKESKDPTRHTFKPFSNKYDVAFLKILERVDLVDAVEIDKAGNMLNFKSNLEFFHPVRHIPPTNPNDDHNMSPVEGKTFAITRSMQNIQVLKGAGGCSKYVLKYITKNDEQNYVIIDVSGKGKMVSKAHYLHNTKVVSSRELVKKGNVQNMTGKFREGVSHKWRCFILC